MATCAAWSAAAADATNVLVAITLCRYPPLSRLMLPWSFLPFVLVAMVAPLAKYHEPVLLLMLLAGPLAFIYAQSAKGPDRVAPEDDPVNRLLRIRFEGRPAPR